MGKNIFFLNKHKHLLTCNTHPKTLSFRATTDPKFESELDLFTNSTDQSPSISTDQSEYETIVRRARSDRLFFDPDSTSSILHIHGSCRPADTVENYIINAGDDGGGGLPCKDSVAVVMETENPYADFRKSMEEMVEIDRDLKDWDRLEELLRWYLRMNEKENHELIVAAFFDLLARSFSSGGGGTDDHGGGSCRDLSVASFTSAASSFSSHVSSPNNGNN